MFKIEKYGIYRKEMKEGSVRHGKTLCLAIFDNGERLFASVFVRKLFECKELTTFSTQDLGESK
ncbi:hypothetical protein [Veronia pacifica]|uniref:Uncharacterized protein n=1 Tax=Veronia pacifica TaxID=1080227 RepID=A0A1C3EPU7_9GAMM|nr:hypothetical protein [Veronia pacifica]ODA35246.1 hypothetical protein A8L45_04865 [Veronia pacifica]